MVPDNNVSKHAEEAYHVLRRETRYQHCEKTSSRAPRRAGESEKVDVSIEQSQTEMKVYAASVHVGNSVINKWQYRNFARRE